MNNTILIFFTVLLLSIFNLNAQQNFMIHIRPDENEEIRLYARSFALVVGINNYTNGWPALRNPINDAYEIKALLEQHGFEVTLLENPTSEQMQTTIRNFIAIRGLEPENRILFYYAGHGHSMQRAYGSSMGYIIPADTPLPDRDKPGFVKKAIDMKTFENYAQTIESKHALFIFDSCFSGSIFSMQRAAPAAVNYKTSMPVRQFITAGLENEPVPDVSIFKQQLIEALQGAGDLNTDGYVTGTELGSFLQDRVVTYSNNTQHPQYGKIRNPQLDKGDFVFKIQSNFAEYPSRPGYSVPRTSEMAPTYPAQQPERIPPTLPDYPPPAPYTKDTQPPPVVVTPPPTDISPDPLRPISLRTKPMLLELEGVIEMIKRQNFFHYFWNKTGSGIRHQYESFEQEKVNLVLDRTTGLIWEQAGSSQPMRYAEVIEYITSLNQQGHAGFRDWRLPTIEEALSLVESRSNQFGLYINPVFDNYQKLISTADRVQDGRRVWIVDFSTGDCYHETFGFQVYVRAVRSFQKFSQELEY